MPSIRRRAKKSYSKWEILQQTLEALEMSKMPRLPCPLTQTNEMVEVGKCVSYCNSHCKNFTSFGYIIQACENNACNTEEPCVQCLEDIEKHKVLFKSIRVSNNKEIEKPRKINYQMKYYRERSGRGVDDEDDEDGED